MCTYTVRVGELPRKAKMFSLFRPEKTCQFSHGVSTVNARPNSDKIPSFPDPLQTYRKGYQQK
ncbi:hypothetical protein CGRA01v4_08298 [Colletotrichum graminicola]|nr:hypothetical protein CGRA01v4_08298 [Colletotrichum graminicola]